MKPPICSICYLDFFDKGGIVYFKETAEDLKVIKQMQESKADGHPPHAFWFCEKHFDTAKKMAHLNKNEAFALLNELFKNDLGEIK